MASEQPRLYFMDNLRYLCVWCVVIFHTTVGYLGLPEFYVETESAPALSFIRQTIVVFTLPLLFMLAGYFVLPSLRKRSAGEFFKQKLLRLGIPFVIGIVFLGPLMPYLGYYAQSFKGLPSASYWDFWSGYMLDGLTNLTRPVVFTTNTSFHHQHFYFLAFLIEIMLAFLLLRALWQRFATRRTQGAAARRKAGFIPAFILAAVGISVGQYLAAQLPVSAQVVAFFFYFSLSDCFLFGGSFALGLYAWHKRWFLDGNLPDWRMLAVLGLVYLVFHQGHDLMHVHRGEATANLLALDQHIVANLLTWLAIALILFVAYKVLNKQNRFNAEMAAASYDMYLLQYPVILALRFPMIDWEAPALLKFAIVVPLTILICWVLSRYLIQPRPKTTLAVVLALHVLLCTFGLPRWGDSHLLLDSRPAFTALVPQPESAAALDFRRPDSLQTLGDAKAAASIAWQDGKLYVGHNQGGLFVLAEGAQTTVIANRVFTDLLAGPDGAVYAADELSNEIVSYQPQSAGWSTIVPYNTFNGKPKVLESFGDRGLFFLAQLLGTNFLFLQDSTNGVKRLSLNESIVFPTALALSPEGKTLYCNNRKNSYLYACDVAPDGRITGVRHFGRLFRGDRRYGDPIAAGTPGGVTSMLADRRGNLYVATKAGVQVFSPEGKLLGIISFPDLQAHYYYPPQPVDLCFGGPHGDTLYIACGEGLYSIPVTL